MFPKHLVRPWLCLVTVGLGGLGCSGASSVAPPPAAPGPSAAAPSAPPPPAAPSPSQLDGGWSTVQLRGVAVAVDLPQAARWSELAGSRWVRLQHAPTRSLLELSVSRERRLVRPSDCEAKARLERPELPKPAEDEALERRRITLRGDMLTEVTVSLENGADELQGHVTWFGASVGRCLLGHFVTRVAGPGRDDEVARRLRMVVDTVVPSLTLLGADQRVQPEPLER
ncbi:MAG: hypothetical protein QM756_28935 [Polyangiaceae bacterium]